MIYAIFSCLNRNSFSRYHASLADRYTDGRKKERKKEESQKIDNLPVLAIRRSDTVEPLYNGHLWGPTFCPL